MTKLKLFHLKNEMLAANFLANFVGVFFVNTTLYVAEGFPTDKEMWQQPLPFWVDALFTPLAFTFVAVMTLLYEKPIRRYLNLMNKQTTIPPDLESKAARSHYLSINPLVLRTRIIHGGTHVVQCPFHRLHHRYHSLLHAGTYFTKKTGAFIFSQRGSHDSAPNVTHQNPNAPRSAPVCL